MSRQDLRNVIDALVAKHGARAVAEELVELFHDKAEELRGPHKDEPASKLWRRLGIAIGNVVHFTHLEWPS